MINGFTKKLFPFLWVINLFAFFVFLILPDLTYESFLWLYEIKIRVAYNFSLFENSNL